MTNRSVNEVHSNTGTERYFTTPNQFRTRRSPMCTCNRITSKTSSSWRDESDTRGSSTGFYQALPFSRIKKLSISFVSAPVSKTQVTCRISAACVLRKSETCSYVSWIVTSSLCSQSLRHRRMVLKPGFLTLTNMRLRDYTAWGVCYLWGLAT